MIIMTTTNIYKGFQLHIPKEIREKHNITEDDQISWRSEGEDIILNVKKQRSLRDLVGLATAKKEFDPVKLKKRSQRGDI
ncbi:MAG: AbrB/MazE/SpoVT family DNA-binding domain-containing protein [Methanosphaera stadtmanae]|nr:AbrB/MazE/SpoVT family DNA-binding domain-containing protein [Methanosphaera stadtmanae]